MKKGNHCSIAEDATIGKDCVLGNNVVIHPGTKIGKNVRIDDNAVIGKQPMSAANSATTKDQALKGATIGDECIIGTNVVIYAGAKIGNKVLIADLATIRENVSIGEQTIVGRNVAIENYCEIGKKCKLETNVYITAYSKLGDHVFVSPGVLTANDNFLGRTEERKKHYKGVTVETGGRLGVGSVILPGKTIKKDAVIAAGTVLTKDAEEKHIYMGIPGKKARKVPDEQLLENQ